MRDVSRFMEEIKAQATMARATKVLLAAVGMAFVLTITIFGLTVAILVKVNRDTGYDSNGSSVPPGTTASIAASTSTTITPTTHLPTLVSSVNVNDAMEHLKELQNIADISNGTRAVSTPGFNRTLDYIYTTLTSKTNFNVSKSFFNVQQFELNSDPIFISSINGVQKNYTFSKTLSQAEFYFIQFSARANFSSFVPITVIPNVGCNDADWREAMPSPAGRVALVKRGICAFVDKGALAVKYNVSGLLFYNDGATSDREDPIAVSLGQNQFLPALFLSYQVGQALADAANTSSPNVSVLMIIDTKDLPPSPVGNICADTPTGDPTQTIIIGSHSDSVPAGPGINDNGSGSAANLALAVTLARLYERSDYGKFPYRVRFCWWGAEEIGLLGSDDHVKQAKNATKVGERLIDYLINLNYDMLGSPNYIFGIYDGQTANNDTPAQARPGSNKITEAFRNWFDEQKLPWTYTDFTGRSDYGPFLAEGIVAGGLFSGADDYKSVQERDQYDRLLGAGMGGIPGIAYDPCYHAACDSIQNIDVFAFEKMVKAAGYMLEYLARKPDLVTWLYPLGRPS